MGRYKNDPEVYRTAAKWLGLEPREVLMVATHGWDLQGASVAGMRTAFIRRPLEWGAGEPPATPPEFADMVVDSFEELVAQV